MAKVIIYGDIDSLTPLYVSVNGSKEVTISKGRPTEISVPAGEVSVFATTISKFQRATMSMSGGGAMGAAANLLTTSTNDYIDGTVELSPDECLLIQVKLKGLKSQIFNKVVNDSEVNDYIDVSEIVEYGAKEAGQKNKWVALLLCMFFGMLGVHRFYEKKIFTGILCVLSTLFLLFSSSIFAVSSEAVLMDSASLSANQIIMIIPALVLFYFWVFDFLRILFRRR